MTSTSFKFAFVVGLVAALATGCAQETTEDVGEAADAVSIFGASTAAKGASFVEIEPGDKVISSIGGPGDALAARASRAYGIAKIGSYLLEKANGDVFGVVTTYDEEGAPQFELVQKIETNESAVASTEAFKERIVRSGDDGAAFSAALEADLASIRRRMAAYETNVRPQGNAGCVGTTMAGLFGTILGAGVGGGSVLALAVSGISSAASTSFTAAVITLGLGFTGFVGVCVAVLGVLTVGMGIVCAHDTTG